MNSRLVFSLPNHNIPEKIMFINQPVFCPKIFRVGARNRSHRAQLPLYELAFTTAGTLPGEDETVAVLSTRSCDQFHRKQPGTRSGWLFLGSLGGGFRRARCFFTLVVRRRMLE